MTPPTFLCLASYYKGDRFLQRCKHEGSPVYLLTVEKLLGEPWPRESLDDLFAVPSFADRAGLVRAVASASGTRRPISSSNGVRRWGRSPIRTATARATS